MRARWIVGALLSTLATLLAAALLNAQAPVGGSSPAEFEAASVKRNDTVAMERRLGFQPGGRFTAVNVPMRLFIAAAYGTPQPLPDFLVIGGPDWLDKERYDVIAKAAGDPPPGPNGPPPIMFEMMRTLLAQRFKLVVHRETRDQPVYALVNTRADGKPGPGLKVSTFDCSTLMAAARGGAPPPPGANTFCGLRNSPGRVQAASASMSLFANSLARGVSRTVVDRTGLTGNFDFALEFTPDQPQVGNLPPGIQPPPSDGPSLFSALQEQLGLKLEPTRAPVDVLVIDSVERPMED